MKSCQAGILSHKAGQNYFTGLIIPMHQRYFDIQKPSLFSQKRIQEALVSQHIKDYLNGNPKTIFCLLVIVSLVASQFTGWLGQRNVDTVNASVSTYTETFSTEDYKDAINTTATWDTGTGKVTLPAGPAWGGLATGSHDNLSDNDGESTRQQMVLDSSGNPYVVWDDGSGGGNFDLYLSRWNGTQWVKKSDGTAGYDIIPKPDAAIFIYGPKIALDSNDNPYIVMTDDNAGGVYFVKWNGSAWTHADGITPGMELMSDSSGAANIVIDSTDRVNMVYYLASGDVVFTRWDNADARWETMGGAAGYENLSNNGFSYEPKIALDSVDNPNIIWADGSSGFGEVFFVRWDSTGGQWESMGGVAGPENISNNAGTSQTPQFSLDSLGNPSVVWADNTEGNDEMYFSYWNGSVWTGLASGSYDNISNSAGSSSNPQIALDSSEKPFVIWEDGTTGNGDVYATYWDGTEWAKRSDGTAGYDNLSDNTGTSGASPAFALSAADIPIVVWYDTTTGNGDVYVSRFFSGYQTPRVAQSTKVSAAQTMITSATLTATHTLNGGSVAYYLSNNGGTSWTAAPSGALITFSSSGLDLRWKAVLTASSNESATPEIDGLSISYSGFPLDLSFDHVIGHEAFTEKAADTSARNLGGGIEGVFSDGVRLFVVDRDFHRVLIWNSIPTSTQIPADVVVGQTTFRRGTNNCAAPTEATLCSPSYVYSDGTKLYISDTNDNRVLIWNTIPTTNYASADVVLGQADFISNLANKGGALDETTLSSPRGIRISGGKLLVTDTGNSRVLIYNSVPAVSNASADIAIGASDLVTAGGGTTDALFSSPYDIEIVGTKLAVADFSNHRILVFNSIPVTSGATADAVIGQADFITGTQVAPTQYSVAGPAALSTDGTKLFMGSYSDARVAIINDLGAIATNSATIDVVLGQPDFVSNAGALTQEGLSNLYGVGYIGGKLFIGDQANGRVIAHNSVPGDMSGAPYAASFVLGQPDFVSNTGFNPEQAGKGGYGSSVLTYGGKLFVASRDFQRIEIFNAIPSVNGATPDIVVGQKSFYHNGNTIDEATLGSLYGMAIADGKLFVADASNDRVLIWNTIPTTNGASADVVVGAPDFVTQGSGAVSEASFSGTCGVGAYGTKLIVCDGGNNRILIWNTIPTTNGASADVVLGTPDMVTAGTGGPTQKDFFGGESLQVDMNGRIIYLDDTSNRVLIWNTIPTTNYASADVVVGQSDFISGTGDVTQSKFNSSEAAISDGTRLFVANYSSDRVLVWKTIPTTNGALADFVIGQDDFVTSTGGTSATKLDQPASAWADGDNIYIAERANRRTVLMHIKPSAPTFITANAATFAGSTNAISWNASTEDKFGIEKYKLYIDNTLHTDSITTTSTNVSATGYSVGSHSYYVVTQSNLGITATSSTQTFTIAAPASTGGTVFIPPILNMAQQQQLNQPPTTQQPPAETAQGPVPPEQPLSPVSNPVTASPAAFSLTRYLSSGSTGSDVTSLQTYLKDNNFLTTPFKEGTYDKATREAVREFQKSIGINPIGVVGPRTRAALRGQQYITNLDHQFTKDLKQGDRDPEVRELQTRLQDQAFFPAYQRKTTYFGAITQRSLILFQKFFAVIDDGLGTFGAKTREFMNPVK